MDLVIFHYHFLTGGVTGVVTKAVKAFREYLPEFKRITLVGGRIPDPRAMADELDVEVVSLPHIDYLDEEKIESSRVREEGRLLAEHLHEEFGSDEAVWWVHNYHLGKNPIFTEALIRLLVSGASQKMILQIHDFPECGRYRNLALLEKTITQPLYPLTGNLRYAVLNARDLVVLRRAGISAEKISLLENPVTPYRRGPHHRREQKAKLASVFSQRFGRFNPDSPLIFYPIRAIRRKNVFEAALISRLLDGSVNLLVSLPGQSRPERLYSELVDRAYREGRIRGLWSIGTGLDRAGLHFEDLVEASDLILSSSVQEGFGYLFINSLQWGLPLAARDLEVLSGLKELFRGYPASFYQRLLCPLAGEQRKELKARYARKITNLTDLIPAPDLMRVEEELDRVLTEELIDFSYLPAELQYELLGSERDHELLRKVNSELLDGIRSLFSRPAPDRNREIEQRFGLRSYARRFRELCQGLFESAKEPCLERAFAAPVDPAEIQSRVVSQFARLDYLRLLYD